MSEYQVGRELRTIVEIEQDFCSLTYGVAPCAAALGVTGSRKCFNTRATCQDAEHYSPAPLVLRFCKPSEKIPDDRYYVPSLDSVTTAPTMINPGKGSSDRGPLGTRASIRVAFKDHPSTDNVVDKYVKERDYDPLARGSFWSKWLARNPYYVNRIIRVREGYVGQTLAEMVTRTYLIDKIDGPDARGRVTITAKDVLKLADDDRAQAPKPSPGELKEDYEAGITSRISVTRALASEYPAPGFVRINDEVIYYGNVTTISDEEIHLWNIARAQFGSETDDHEVGDRVQLCLHYSNWRVDRIARDLLLNYGNIDAAWIDDAAWNAEASVWLQQFELFGIITEPTGVTELLSELTEQCLFYIWWDERVQLIRLQAIKPFTGAAIKKINDNSNIVEDSAALTQDPKGRVSQVWVYFGQRDATEDLDKDSNYRRVRIRADLEAEGPQQYGEQQIRKIFSRWIQSDAQAINVSTRLLSRYRNTPRFLKLTVDAKDRDSWTGDTIDVLHRGVVDDTGAPLETRYQILSAEETVPGHTATYNLEVFEYSIDYRLGRWMAANAPTYDQATEEQRATGAWWADEAGNVGGDPGYNWT